MNEFFQRLRQRKLVQWAVAYVAAAFALLQGIDIVAQQFGWPDAVRRGITLALCVGFFITLVLAWYHGERGAQRVTGTELLIIGLVLSLGGGLLWRFAAISRAAAESPNDAKISLTPAIPEKSIAVLPFDNLSHDPENAYFAEGIQDEILTRLAKIAQLKVVARTSTERFKNSNEDLRQAAQQLGVANFLEGSVQKVNDEVRVNVQLIRAASQAHLWAEVYDRKLTDIFAVESDIARTVAETLQAKLTGSAEQVLASRPTDNPEAHQLYLKGRYFWNQRTADTLQTALAYFEQAIEKDPSYALAYAGLADCYSLIPVYTNVSPKENIARSLAAARRAVALDDNLAEAHTALGNALGTDLQISAAEAEFRRALVLNPNYATAHQWLGECLQARGHFDEALAQLKTAHDLDPLSLIINCVLASVLDCAGRDDEALQQIQRVLELDPNFGVGHLFLGQILEDQGKLDEAVEAYKKAEAEFSQTEASALIACIYARTGRVAEARKILGDLASGTRRDFISSCQLAQIHAALGEKEEAMRLLEKAYDERSIQFGGNDGSPLIDKRFISLRGDPRFQKLMDTIFGPAR